MQSRLRKLRSRWSIILLAGLTAAIGIAALGALGGTAEATETDTTQPTVALSGTAIGAVEAEASSGSYELTIKGTDAGSGVAKVEVAVDGSGQQSWEKYCPEGGCSLEETWSYSPATYSTHYRAITVIVTDHAGNKTEELISPEGVEEIPREAAPTEADTTPPTVTFSGSAVSAIGEGAATGEYELRMKALDGSPSAPQSGVAKIEVAVDGTTLQSWEKYCPVGSCRLETTWPYVPSSYTGTSHVVTVTVRDHAGNVTEETLTPEEPLGEANGDAPACGGGEGSPTTVTGPGGGSILVYTLADGTIVEVPRPPAGFDIVAASASELEAYGFPPKPSGKAAQEEWVEEYEGATVETSGSLCSAAAALLPPFSEPFEQNRFSGYYALEREDPTAFTGVKGTYKVPAAGKTTACKVSGEASWVGLGELHNGFVQAGTLLYNGGAVRPIVQLWPKAGAGGGVDTILPPMHVSPEDHLSVSISYSKSREKVYYSFKDPETGHVQPIPVHKPLSTAYYSGEEIQWFEERPYEWAGENLKNFGVIPWTHARGLSSSSGVYEKMTKLDAEPEVLVERNPYKVLAEPTGIGPSGEGFQDDWQACRN